MSKVFVIKDGKYIQYDSVEALKEDIGEEEFNKLKEMAIVPPQPLEPPVDAIPYLATDRSYLQFCDIPDGRASRRQRRAQERKPKKKNKPIWK